MLGLVANYFRLCWTVWSCWLVYALFSNAVEEEKEMSGGRGPISVHYLCWGDLGTGIIGVRLSPGESEGTSYNSTFYQVRGKAGWGPLASLLTVFATMASDGQQADVICGTNTADSKHIRCQTLPQMVHTIGTVIHSALVSLEEMPPSDTIIFLSVSIPLRFKLPPCSQGLRAGSQGENSKGEGWPLSS